MKKPFCALPWELKAITFITGNILLPFLVTIISLVRDWNLFQRLASSSWTEGALASGSLWQLLDGPRHDSRCSGTSDMLTFNWSPSSGSYLYRKMPNDLAPELSQDVCAPWELSGDCSPPIVGLGSGCASAGQDGGGTSVAIARVQHCTPPTDLYVRPCGMCASKRIGLWWWWPGRRSEDSKWLTHLEPEQSGDDAGETDNDWMKELVSEWLGGIFLLLEPSTVYAIGFAKEIGVVFWRCDTHWYLEGQFPNTNLQSLEMQQL